MSYTYSFEKLETWKAARALVKWIYGVTKNFPLDEKYGLVLQLRRSAISVVSNIAEGSARNSPKDKAHFYQVAYSSVIEILNQLIVSNDLNFISDATLVEGRAVTQSLTLRLYYLRKAELGKLSQTF